MLWNPVRTIFAFILFAIFSQILPAQVTFERAYGGDQFEQAAGVKQLRDGGYIMAGITKSFRPANDVYLVRTNSSGDTVWTRYFGNDEADGATDIELTPDGGFIISGSTRVDTAMGTDILLAKVASNGMVEWSKAIGGSELDYAHEIVITSDAGYAMAAHSSSFGAASIDMLLVKTNINGDTSWIKRFGGGDTDVGRSLIQLKDGGFLIAGYSASFGNGSEDIFLVRTNALGEELWSKVYGGGETDRAYSVVESPKGGYLVAGYTESAGAGGRDMYLLRIDTQGDTLWTRTIGGAGDDEGRAVVSNLEGSFIIAGQTESEGAGKTDVYLVKVSGDGAVLWSRTHGGSGWDYPAALEKTSDGGFITVGKTYSFGDDINGDMYAVKTNDRGLVTELDLSPDPLPAELSLHQNSPNPFSVYTELRYSIGKPGSVTIEIVDIRGVVLDRFTRYHSSYGPCSLTWHAASLPAGIYFQRVRNGNIVTMKKMLLYR